jgi:hypothetical protein
MNLSEQFAKTGDVPMFATAREIIEGTHLIDFRPGNIDKEGLMAKKLREASEPRKESARVPGSTTPEYIGHRGGLTDAVKEHGYDWSQPVSVEPDLRDPENPRLTLIDGHHRVAVMDHLHPDQFIPIKLYRGKHGVAASWRPENFHAQFYKYDVEHFFGRMTND